MDRAVMPEEKRQVKETLKDALEDVQSQTEAERVVDDLERVAEGVSEEQAARGAAASPVRAAESVAPGPQAADLLDTAQQVLIPEARGERPAAEVAKPRGYLRRALFRRMSPLQAWDAWLFVAANNLPHTKLTNSLMYALTVVATGGVCWSAGAVLAYLRGSRRGRQALRELCA